MQGIRVAVDQTKKKKKNQIEMTEITKANDSPKILFCFVFLRDE
jgi:hypothetical protein